MAKDQVLIQKINRRGVKETLNYDAKKFEERKDQLAKDGYSKIGDQVKEQKPEPIKEVKDVKKEEPKKEAIPEINKETTKDNI